MHSRFSAGIQLRRAHQMSSRIRGPLLRASAQKQSRILPHARTATEQEVGLTTPPRTVSTHAARTATLDRHVSIESWEAELEGRQQLSVAVRRAEGSSSITPWRRSSAGLHT